MNGDDLDYRRAKDKADKSLEIYKFYVNALYVALTRAIRNLYLIESDTGHPLLRLLDVRQGSGEVKVDAAASTRDDWQKEARKLELQGKQEQAEAIRQSILKETPVPWPVFDEARLRDTLVKVFREQVPGGKAKQQLYEYAACYDEPVLAAWLASEANSRMAGPVEQQRTTLGRKHFAAYFSPHFKNILQLCDRHGIDHRTPMNQTPLIAAAAAGNVALVEALLARGANPEHTDHLGRNALHWALLEAFHDEKFARGPFAALYELIAPAAIDVMSGERLVRIDRHLSEYLLFQTLWALFKSRFTGYSWDEIRRLPDGGHSRRLATPAAERPAAGTQQASAPVPPAVAQRGRPRLRLQPPAVCPRGPWLVPVQSGALRAATQCVGRGVAADLRCAQRPLRRGVRGPAALGAHRHVARPGGTTADGHTHRRRADRAATSGRAQAAGSRAAGHGSIATAGGRYGAGSCCGASAALGNEGSAAPGSRTHSARDRGEHGKACPRRRANRIVERHTGVSVAFALAMCSSLGVSRSSRARFSSTIGSDFVTPVRSSCSNSSLQLRS